MAIFVSSVVLCLAASVSALVPVQPSVQVDPKLSYTEWVDVLSSQAMVPEACDGCRVGTEPQPDVAGRVAEGAVEPQIIGGQVAQPGQFPWQAQVRMDERFFCGGSIISQQWVLTAGHCGSGYSKFTIVLGSFSSQNTNEPNKVTMVSRDAKVHEGYDPFLILNDIALVSLPLTAKMVAWSDFIRPVRLPSLSQAANDFAGVPAVVSGWGRYGSSTVSPSISPVLRFVELTTLANTECAQSFGSAIRPTNICTSGKGIKGACNGDSGGALTVQNKDGSRIQLGIVSFGTSLGCNKEYPSAYTRVTAFLKWISDKTNIAIAK